MSTTTTKPISGYRAYGCYMPEGYATTAVARTSPAPVKRQTPTAEVRASKNGMTVYGFACPFNSLSVNLGGFRERILPGAFARSLLQVAQRKYDVLCLSEHDSRGTLGRTGVNVRLWEDDQGLRYEVDLPRTSLGQDVAELVRLGIVRGASISFSNPVYEWGRPVDSVAVREVSDLRLHEFSFVGSPAYPATTASVLRCKPNDVAWRAARLRQAAAWSRVRHTPLSQLVLPGNAQRSFVVGGLERR